jgi:hypothetical protein
LGRHFAERTLCLLLICAGIGIAGHTAYSLFSPRLYWLDEYFTIWCADPAASLAELISERLRTDTHPPAFYLLLHPWLKAFGTSPTSTGLFGIALSSSVLLCAGVYAALRSALPLFAVFTFLLLGSFGYRLYLLELRSYAFVTSVAALLTLATVMLTRSDTRTFRSDAIVLVASGSLLSLTHVFGAIIAGAAAGALVLSGIVHRKRRLFLIGLAAGLVFTMLYGAWFLYSSRFGSQLMAGGDFWLQFTPRIARREFITFSKFALTDLTGALVVPAVVFLGFAAIAAWHAWSPGVLVLTLMLGGFVAIPFLASLYFPMVFARYFLPGLAPLYLLAALLVVERWQAVGDIKPMVAVLGVAAVLAILIAPPALHVHWHSRPFFWRTEPVVRACLIPACVNSSVRVLHWPPWATGIPTFQMVEGVYNIVLRDYGVRAEPHRNAPLRDVADGQCPVVGWAEATRFDPTTTSDAELLARLRLANPKGVPISVHRHKEGFAVLRSDLPCTQ